MNFTWMAWTWPTAAFFLSILGLLVMMSVWEAASPGGHPRHGILRFETTRGDRLFVSLLGSAFLFFGSLFFFEDATLWPALALCLVYAVLVFRFV